MTEAGSLSDNSKIENQNDDGAKTSAERNHEDAIAPCSIVPSKVELHEAVVDTFPLLLKAANHECVTVKREMWTKQWEVLKNAIRTDVLRKSKVIWTKKNDEKNVFMIGVVKDCIIELGSEEAIGMKELEEIGTMIIDKLEKEKQRNVGLKLWYDGPTLIDTIAELVHDLIEMLGITFFNILEPSLPLVFWMIQYCCDEANWIAVFCSIRLFMIAPSTVFAYSEQISDLFMLALSRREPIAQQLQNAAWRFGEMAMLDHDGWKREAAQSLDDLSAMITREDARSNKDEEEATDNLITAIAKILKHTGKEIIEEEKYNEILSMFLTWLPCCFTDKVEAKHTFGFLADVLEAGNEIVLGKQGDNLAQIHRIVNNSLSNDIFDDSPESEVVKGRLQAIINEMTTTREI